MITFLFVGKTENDYRVLFEEYKKRIERFTKINSLELQEIKDIGKLSVKERKKKEAQEILISIKNSDYLIILDEKGQMLSSLELSYFIEKKQQISFNLVFLVGGAYGFDDIIYQRANSKISLSNMTFTHQMVRIFLIEQVYRAFTIINKMPYHH